MHLRHNLPIQRKMLLMTLSICGVVLLVASLILFLYQSLTFRADFQRDLATVAQIIADNSTAALAFSDQKAAQEIISALEAKPFILCACLTQKDGSVVAQFGEVDDHGELQQFPPAEQFRFLGGHLLYTHDVTLDRKRVGSLYLRADYQRVFSRLLGVFALVLLGILAVSAALATFLSSRLQRSITGPVVQLAQTAQLIGEKQDYSLRAVVAVRGDELADLATAFNQMLERIQAQDVALRESEARYRLLIENQGEGAGLVNAAERFTLANPAADDLLGVPPGTLVGRSLREFISAEDYTRMQRETKRRQRGERSAYELEIARPDGRRRLLAVTATPIYSSAGEFMGTFGVFRDITEHKRAEAELRERYRAEQLIAGISTNFINLPSHDIGTGIDGALRAVGEFARADRAYVFILSENARSGSNTNEWCAAGIPPTLTRAQNIPTADFPWWMTKLSRQETIHIPNVADLPPEAAAERVFLQSRGVHSAIAVPLVLSGSLRGFFGFDTVREPRTWSEADCRMLILAAQIFVNALERQRVEHEVEELNQQLIASSRRAGMAEVATGVLHNVGNVLNSVNVSATLVADRLRQFRVASLARASDLLCDHLHELPRFLSEDSKGRMLPGYLKSLAGHLQAEQTFLIQEIEQLTAKVSHIKEIVAMQQSYARVAGHMETLPASVLLEDALRINAASFARHDIQIVRHFLPVAPVLVDRHKVLQILVNLLANAKHALLASDQPARVITLGLEPSPNCVRISVQDNGAGIAPENLTRIFQHGFTTRKDGHGFGLHSGALAAQEMGGALRAHSEGCGKGARFTLDVPLSPAAGAALAAPEGSLSSIASSEVGRLL